MRKLLGVGAVLAVVWSQAAILQAACTPPYAPLPNVRVVAETATDVTIGWDPGLFPIARVYSFSGSYCATLTPVTTLFGVLDGVKFSFAPQNGYAISVFDPASCREADFSYDRFGIAPQPIPVPAISVAGGTVAFSLTYEDHYVLSILERREGGGSWFAISSSKACPNPLLIDPFSVPGHTYDYRINATNSSGSQISPVYTVTVPPLRIVNFQATPATIRAGGSATLSWTTENARSVLINNVSGTLPTSGSVTVSPSSTTTYTLTAMNGGSTATATATVNVITEPAIAVTALPSPLMQIANAGGATSTYALTNSGGAPTTITLTQDGSFFTQTPSAPFTLAPGATQVVTVTGVAQPAGSYDGASIPQGAGVPSGLRVPVRLFSTSLPPGPVRAEATSSTVDTQGAAGAVIVRATFTNSGTATLNGILGSDVPWIAPSRDPISIAPGETKSVDVSIDRTKRPDGTLPFGSADGTLSLSYFSTQPFGKGALDSAPPIPSVTLVKVVDTATPQTQPGGVPALAAGEVALFVPGVGHIANQGTQFVSDVALLNAQSSAAVGDVRFYYTGLNTATPAQSLAIPALSGTASVAVADVVKNAFNGNEEIGTLHIRSRDADKLVVAASLLASRNATGTYGTSIPTFRSDRAVAAGETVVLSGVRKDAGAHTDLYVQEMAGLPATIKTDFLASDGSTIGTRNDSIDAFKLLQVANAVPPNAVAIIITNTSTAGGRIGGYAMLIDEVSKDTSILTDADQQFGGGTGPMVIPAAGNVHGANQTFYQTDVSLTNRGASQASGTLRYITRGGDKIDRQITLGARQTNAISDVVGTLFNVAGDSTGFMLYTPVTGSVAITSRTFATVGGKPGTFGTGVPPIAVSRVLKAGAVQSIAAIDDATRSAVVAGRPGTVRTNFALMEISGSTVTVRVTFRYLYPDGEKVGQLGAVSRDYTIGPFGFFMLNSIAGEILGPFRNNLGDLHGTIADFEITSGTGSVVLFTSSVDNRTGDAILRVQ